MDHPAVEKTIIKNLEPNQPIEWLIKGWRDFKCAPLIGLVHGAGISLLGFLLLALAYDKFWILAGASTGFLAFAPVVAVGLYAVSRALELGRPATFELVFRTWWSWRGRPHHDWRLVRFGLLLCFSGAGWVLTSAALITLFSEQPVNQPLDFLKHVVLSKDNYLFELWLILGGVLGAPVFASTVVTLPLLLDRKITILDAVLISWKAVMQNPLPLAIWAAIIMVFTLSGVIVLVGSVFVIPVLGHASWHAYRDTVDAEQLPPRVKE